MTAAALAVCHGLLIHSTHCDGAGQGQDGGKVLGPFYTCLTNGTLKGISYTGPRYDIIKVEYFDKNSKNPKEARTALEHCPEDEEW